MIILDDTLSLLEVTLTGAITTSQLDFVASYVDINQSTFEMTGILSNDGTTNSTTTVTAIAAPAATTSRQLKYLSVINTDTVAATVIVKFDNGTNERKIIEATLAVDDTLVYIDGAGWHTLDSSGNTKVTSTGGVTDHTALSNIGTNTHAQIDTHLALTDEHIDWSLTNAKNIHADNYTDTIYTHPNHTGDVTSTGDGATVISAGAVDIAMLANGVDGELITWDATGAPATVAVGTATHVLTSNGVGVAPTFQAAAGGGDPNFVGEDTSPSPVATGTDSLAMGVSADATFADSIAIGSNSQATASINNIAIGKAALADGANNNSIAIGANSDAGGGQGAIAIGGANSLGDGAAALASNAVVVGRYADGTGIACITIGSNALAGPNPANFGIAIGSHTDSSGSSSIAIGGATSDATSADATADNAISLGINTLADATEAIAIGDSADAGGVGCIAIGDTASAGTLSTNINCIAIGTLSLSDSTGDNNIAIGTNSQSTGTNSIAIGGSGIASFGAYAIATNSLAIGYDAYASSSTDIAIGSTATASGGNSICLGTGLASSDAAIAIGLAATASTGADAIAIGRNTDATGANSIAIGGHTTDASSADAAGTASIAIGSRADATTNFGIAIGYNAQSTASYAVTLGENVEASANSSMAVGRRSVAPNIGQFSHSANRISVDGDAQFSRFVCMNATTDAATNVFLNPDNQATNRMLLADTTLWTFDITITARQTGGAAGTVGDCYIKNFKGAIDRDGVVGNTALVGTTMETLIAQVTLAPTIAISADITLGALQIQVNGELNKNINWVAVVNLVEVVG